MESSSNNKLSSDMIFEVLSRTCLQTLNSSRIVCKDWNKLTYYPIFMDLHARKTNTVSGYLVQDSITITNEFKSKFVSINGNNNISLEFLNSNKMKVEASSDQGLIVCVSLKNFRFYICKPSTKQLVALPDHKTGYIIPNIALIVLSAKPLHYKIVKLEWIPRRGLIGEIFDSVSWEWKEIREVLLPSTEHLKTRDPPICAGGLIYFLTFKDRILAFDAKSESFDIFPLPNPVYENPEYNRKRIEGMLGFTCKAPNGFFELWIMKKKLWKKRMVWTSQVLEEEDEKEEGEFKYPVLGGFCNSAVALVQGLVQGERTMIFYDVTRSCNLYQERLEDMLKIFPFRSDFELINLN